MLMTDRDLEILNFINMFGFCEMPNIERRFGVKSPRSYRIIKRLIKGGLVNHERIFHNRHGVYYLTSEGAKFTDLPAISNIPKDNYKHQLLIIEIYFKLLQTYPYGQWTSERILKRDQGEKSHQKKTHIPDGVLKVRDDIYAVEVELTLKSSRRIEQIFNFYASQINLTEVWYFCPKNINKSLEKYAKNKPYIKLHTFEESV